MTFGQGTPPYKYGDMVILRGHPYLKSRQAVRVYSTYKTGTSHLWQICIELPSGAGVAVLARYLRKAKRQNVRASQATLQKKP